MNSTDRRAAEGILFTDEYQLTMAQLYYRMGLHEKQVQFEHFFRSYPDYGSHRAGYCVNAKLLNAAPKHAMVLHCLPAYRGLEISEEVLEGPRSLVFPEAENRLHFQKGLLAVLLGGQ